MGTSLHQELHPGDVFEGVPRGLVDHSRVGGDGRIGLRELQTRILVMSQILPLSEVKARFSEIVEVVSSTHERVTVTRNGRPTVVVVSVDDLEAVEETLALLSDPEAMRAIEEGRTAIAASDFVTLEDLEALRAQLRTRST
jgi:antitoxin YefM